MRLLLALGVLLCAQNASAYKPLAYPGWTWGYVGRDLSGIDGNVTQGNAAQGVDWARLPLGFTFETYGGYSWRARSKNRDYFDARGPFVGAIAYRKGLTLGADYSWQEYPRLDETTRSPSVFASWYYRRDASPFLGLPRWGERRALAAPFSTWGRLQHDVEGNEGLGSLGWIQQGVDWTTLPGGVVLDTFAAFRWRARARNNQYYDAFGPAVGVDLVKGPVDLSVQYAWRRYPSLERWSSGPELALTWYFAWDLAKLAR